ncbi:unnamed protein product, partial [Laminaria digitata]
GLCALIAAKVVEPRTGRFRLDGTVNRLPQQSPALQTLGALILWVGWYGFNGGSVGSVSHGRSELVAEAVVNTTIAAAASVLSMGVLMKCIYKKFDSRHLNNGILSGLVAISASGPLMYPEGAFIVGILASAFYLLGVEALKRLKIDDVVQSSAVHFGCGMWGLISAGLLTSDSRYRDVYSFGAMVESDSGENKCCGLLYGCGGSLLGANLIFMLAIVAWVGVLCYLCLLGIKHTVGLRVPLHVEEMGMDKSRHGRQSRGSIALRRALRSAAAPENRSSSTSSHRPSFKSSHTISPRTAPTMLSHWRD